MKVVLHLKNSLKFMLVALISLLLHQASAQTVIISPTGAGGFENGGTFAANGWTAVNGTGITNTWQLGTVPTGFTNRSAFISKDAGVSWKYDTAATAVVHFYRDVTFPAGVPTFTLTFQWKGVGEVAANDALMVSLAPTGYTPVASTVSLGTNGLAAPANTLTQLNNQSGLQTFTYTINSADIGNCNAAVTMRLIFTWKNNDILGVNPPAVIDNISLVGNPLTINHPADRCTDGTNITYSSTPMPGGLNTGVFTTQPFTASFIDNHNGSANFTMSSAEEDVYTVYYTYTTSNCIFRILDTVQVYKAPVAQCWR
jgi:hypothetical protein